MGGWDNYGRGFMRPDHSVPAIMESGLTTLNDVQSHSMTSPLDRHDLLMPQ